MSGPGEGDRHVFTVPVVANEQNTIDEWIENQQRPLEKGKDVAPTGFPTWDRASRDEGGGMGLALGWHVIVAGNTGHGKSLVGLNLASQAIRHGMTVGFVSLEMAITQLETRLYAIISGDPVRPLERGPGFDVEAATATGRKVAAMGKKHGGWFVTNQDLYEPLRYWHEVRDLMDDWRERFNVGMFVLDYMQMIGASELDDTQIAQQVGKVSRATMGYAKSRKVITVGISQFNRSTSRDYDSPPVVQGLFGWSGMENDAHQVVMLDHSRYQKPPNVNGARTWLIVGKNRHGMKPEIPVFISYDNLRVREADPHEEHKWPGADR